MVRDKVTIRLLFPAYNKIRIDQNIGRAIRPRTIHPSSPKYICNTHSYDVIFALPKQLTHVYAPRHTKYIMVKHNITNDLYIIINHVELHGNLSINFLHHEVCRRAQIYIKLLWEFANSTKKIELYN